MQNPLPSICLSTVPGRRDSTIELAKEIERRGFAGIYSASFGGPMGLCHVLARETERILFGTSIVNIYTRNVMDYAESAAFIHETSGGRFRFGVGVSHEGMNNRLGVTTGKPLTDMRNFVEPVSAAKRIGDLPPIVLAGLRDKMMSLSAEVGGGVTFANVSRKAVPASLERMKQAHPVGDDFFVSAMIPTCISDDHDAAAAKNRKTLTMYVGLPNYRNYWSSVGYEEEMAAIAQVIEAGERERVTEFMTDEWLSDVSLFGSASEVLEGLEAWYDTGITTPILVPSSAAGNSVKAMEELFAIF